MCVPAGRFFPGSSDPQPRSAGKARLAHLPTLLPSLFHFQTDLVTSQKQPQCDIPENVQLWLRTLLWCLCSRTTRSTSPTTAWLTRSFRSMIMLWWKPWRVRTTWCTCSSSASHCATRWCPKRRWKVSIGLSLVDWAVLQNQDWLEVGWYHVLWAVSAKRELSDKRY